MAFRTPSGPWLMSVDTFCALGLVSSETAQSSPNEQFYDFNARGNVSQRLSSGGFILSTDVYNAYGKLLSGNGSGDEFGFGGQAGYRTDAETGLVLLTHRYYDPAAGRFLTRDPMGYDGGVNLYAYTQNDPVSRSDPSGYCINWRKAVPTIICLLLGNCNSLKNSFPYPRPQQPPVVERPTQGPDHDPIDQPDPAPGPGTTSGEPFEPQPPVESPITISTPPPTGSGASGATGGEGVTTIIIGIVEGIGTTITTIIPDPLPPIFLSPLQPGPPRLPA